ncbi:MAG: cadmium-translocating P-type ATPase [Chlamydiae bacterium]|nr:cadmium-translocating P-type ATPase [Chlamydiota bacterium]
MASPNFTQPKKTPARYSKEAIIAIVTSLCIVLNLALRWTVSVPELYQELPLYLALALGGAPLVFQLTLNLIRFEFSSDLIAGISIVSAALLGQYLVGAIVVLMLSGGQALELFAVRRASFLLEALAKRMPSIAHRRKGEASVDIPIDQIDVGDLLIIYPHEICPVDGIVAEERGVMDESYLTGEPFLISKTPGASVLSGAINGDSMLVIRAAKKASDSRYAKIMQVMLESEQRKPRIRRLGDLLGAYYTPLALIIAALSWALSGESIRFLAVLVIATPCPLLLAIPVAIIGGISLSAKKGIIIKNPMALEQISECRTMIFDKTGTLTYGRPILASANYYNNFSSKEGLALAATLEKYSKHPLSAPIIEAAEKEEISIGEAVEINEKPGEGLIGKVDHRRVVITGRSLLIKEKREEIISQLPEKVGLECILLIDDQLAAHYRFHDMPRKDSRAFIAHLGPKHHFTRLLIVSGDRETEVRYLAEQIGIKEIYADQSPEQKVGIVDKENKTGKVIYLGDGINDAPALAVSTVGIAFGQNSDITAEAADAVILDSSLERVDEFLHISKRMRQIALQSAVGGMALSSIGMFVAGLGYLPPLIGAISQEVIDVFVILNALRMAFPQKKLIDYQKD